LATVVAQGTPAYRERTMPGPPTGTFELMRRWQEYLEVSGRCNANTRRQYRRTLVAFVADTLIELADVTEDDVISYVAGCSPRGGRRAMVLRALHSFYGWAERRQVLASPVRAIPIPREKYGKAPTLEAADRALLFKAAESVDPRARPTMELMYATGARLGSICAVRPEDLFLSASGRRWVRFTVAKDDRPYEVPLGPIGEAAFDRLLELADWRPKRARARLPTLIGVRPSAVWTWVNQASTASGIRAWPHLLRHTFATDLDDLDDRTWAAMMNHRDASLRRRYAAPRDERMEAAAL
jgi:site-specific recombinase XerD